LRPSPPYRVSVAFASFVLAIVAASLFAPVAHAAGIEGQWKQGGLREEYTVQQWLPGCGRAPANGTIGGGEVIAIKEEGDELSFVGGGRVFRTNQCYDEMPTLVRQTHSREGSGRIWRTRCATPPADPRNAVMNTLVSVTSDTHIDLVETGRYEITLKEGRCTADVKRTRSFELVPAAAAASTTQPPPKVPEVVRPPEPPGNVCATPGEAARLEVRPSKKVVKTGESFGFQAVVRDGKGCATVTPTTWSVSPGAENKVTVDPTGKVTVASDAAEGSVDVVVTAAGKSAHVTVEVSSAAHYDALLAQLGDNDEPAVAVIATGSLGGDAARAEGDARRRRNVFIAIVSVIGGALLIIALIGVRRSRRAAAIAREAEERHAQRLAEAEERRREKVAKHAAAQRAHEESVDRATRVAEAHAAEVAAASAAPEMGFSGVGGAGFGPPATKGKICPTCGGRFDGAATFCGKDGTALVLLN
jgi:hypothetical protein